MYLLQKFTYVGRLRMCWQNSQYTNSQVLFRLTHQLQQKADNITEWAEHAIIQQSSEPLNLKIN